MPEEVLFESESKQSRESIATYLRRVASNLEEGAPITLTAGGESVTLEPAATSTFEVKAEREGSADDGEVSVEFELEWREGADETERGSLEIE
ncbi:amphi-Trp domain-containing protein [Halobacterium zhouii]|uniref:amphi-Trp domain-containing protein n=1 Tax=Halobacterium zhouii TaxID=2902624 RepID=UPI001E4A13DD|nr:amphi-Trp domain-containing protein [Halobacterium zhouii]